MLKHEEEKVRHDDFFPIQRLPSVVILKIQILTIRQSKQQKYYRISFTLGFRFRLYTLKKHSSFIVCCIFLNKSKTLLFPQDESKRIFIFGDQSLFKISFKEYLDGVKIQLKFCFIFNSLPFPNANTVIKHNSNISYFLQCGE